MGDGVNGEDVIVIDVMSWGGDVEGFGVVVWCVFFYVWGVCVW